MVSLFNQVWVWGYLPGICKSRQNYCCNHFDSLSRSEQAEQGGRAQPACVTKVQYLLKWLFTTTLIPRKVYILNFTHNRSLRELKLKNNDQIQFSTSEEGVLKMLCFK